MGKVVAIVDYDWDKDLQGLAGPAWFTGMAGFSRVGSFGGLMGDVIRFKNLEDLVDNTIANADNSLIDSYTILCHGDDSSLWFNDYDLGLGRLVAKRSTLIRLQQVLSGEARVNLKACLIGRNQSFLKFMASSLFTPVYAGTGNEQMVYPYNEGDYLRCSPDGTIRKVERDEFYDR